MKNTSLCVLACVLGAAAPVGFAAAEAPQAAVDEAAAPETVSLTIVSCKGGG